MQPRPASSVYRAGGPRTRRMRPRIRHLAAAAAAALPPCVQPGRPGLDGAPGSGHVGSGAPGPIDAGAATSRPAILGTAVTALAIVLPVPQAQRSAEVSTALTACFTMMEPTAMRRQRPMSIVVALPSGSLHRLMRWGRPRRAGTADAMSTVPGRKASSSIGTSNATRAGRPGASRPCLCRLRSRRVSSPAFLFRGDSAS